MVKINLDPYTDQLVIHLKMASGNFKCVSSSVWCSRSIACCCRLRTLTRASLHKLLAGYFFTLECYTDIYDTGRAHTAVTVSNSRYANLNSNIPKFNQIIYFPKLNDNPFKLSDFLC